MEDSIATFEIELMPVGGKVVVNGENISGKITGLNVNSQATQPTVLTLQSIGRGVIKGTGIVEVIVPVTSSAAVRELDPTQVEKLAMERLGWGEGNIVSAVLATIVEMLDEAESGPSQENS